MTLESVIDNLRLLSSALAIIIIIFWVFLVFLMPIIKMLIEDLIPYDQDDDDDGYGY